MRIFDLPKDYDTNGFWRQEWHKKCFLPPKFRRPLRRAKPRNVRTLKRKIFEHLKLSELVKYLGTIRKSELKKDISPGHV